MDKSTREKYSSKINNLSVSLEPYWILIRKKAQEQALKDSVLSYYNHG
jgi:hypothetical protein